MENLKEMTFLHFTYLLPPNKIKNYSLFFKKKLKLMKLFLGNHS